MSNLTAAAVQALLLDVLTCADVQQTADNAHFFVFEEAMRCGYQVDSQQTWAVSASASCPRHAAMPETITSVPQ